MICVEAMCLFLVRRYLIHIVQRARRLEVSCGGMDLCTTTADLSARSYHVADDLASCCGDWDVPFRAGIEELWSRRRVAGHGYTCFCFAWRGDLSVY